jgi:hypothetical protein
MKFWKRYSKANIGSKEITSDDLDIYFKVATSTDGTADTAEISIFNLSETTKQGLAPDQPVNLQAGYEGDYGTIYVGNVSTIEDEIDGADIKTTITCVGLMKNFLGGYVNKSYPANTKLTDIAKDQIQLAGISNFQVDDSPLVFAAPKGYTSATSLHTNLTELAKNLDYDFTERRGSVLLMKKTGGIQEGFVLNSDSGLLEVKKAQQKDTAALQYDFEVKALLIYRIDKASIIELDSKISGKKLCRVESCEFQSTEAESILLMKVKIV